MNLDAREATPETSIFDNGYDQEVYQDNWLFERGKTMKAIFAIGAIVLISDLIALSIGNQLNGVNFLVILVVPGIYAGLGFMARHKPMVAMVMAILLFTTVLALSVYAYGAASLFKGFIMKAVVVYFMISGFNHAREAERARKNLLLFR